MAASTADGQNNRLPVIINSLRLTGKLGRKRKNHRNSNAEMAAHSPGNVKFALFFLWCVYTGKFMVEFFFSHQ
jgi:hypothetical protein